MSDNGGEVTTCDQAALEALEAENLAADLVSNQELHEELLLLKEIFFRELKIVNR